LLVWSLKFFFFLFRISSFVLINYTSSNSFLANRSERYRMFGASVIARSWLFNFYTADIFDFKYLIIKGTFENILANLRNVNNKKSWAFLFFNKLSEIFFYRKKIFPNTNLCHEHAVSLTSENRLFFSDRCVVADPYILLERNGYINIFIQDVSQSVGIQYTLLYSLYNEFAVIILVIEIGKRNYRGCNRLISGKPPTFEFWSISLISSR